MMTSSSCTLDSRPAPGLIFLSEGDTRIVRRPFRVPANELLCEVGFAAPTGVARQPLHPAEGKPEQRRGEELTGTQVVVEGVGSALEDILTGAMPGWLRDLVPRILSLEQLEANWDGRDSDPPSRWLVARVLRYLSYSETDSFPKPELVPSCGGGIQLEWYMGNREFEVDFRPDGTIEFLETDNRRREDCEGLVATLDDFRSRLAWVIGDR